STLPVVFPNYWLCLAIMRDNRPFSRNRGSAEHRFANWAVGPNVTFYASRVVTLLHSHCQHLIRIYSLGNHNAYPVKEHLVPALMAPSDLCRGIGVVLVISRIVPARDQLDARAFGDFPGFLFVVNHLPIEVVVWHANEHFRLPGRVMEFDVHGLSAQVH